jgi:hypothetical protein
MNIKTLVNYTRQFYHCVRTGTMDNLGDRPPELLNVPQLINPSSFPKFTEGEFNELNLIIWEAWLSCAALEGDCNEGAPLSSKLIDVLRRPSQMLDEEDTDVMPYFLMDCVQPLAATRLAEVPDKPFVVCKLVWNNPDTETKDYVCYIPSKSPTATTENLFFQQFCKLFDVKRIKTADEVIFHVVYERYKEAFDIIKTFTYKEDAE